MHTGRCTGEGHVSDVDQAASQLANLQYYETNLSLKHVQDSVRYNLINLSVVPAMHTARPAKTGLREPVTPSAYETTDANTSK